MSDKRKLGPIRQLSLQADIQARPILKKQLSVEHLESIEERRPRTRGVESAKSKLSDRPRPVKVAWAENRQSSRDDPLPPKSNRLSDPVEVKKCKEFKRPTTAKLRTQPSLEKDSILYTRQELAEKLRKAWKEREDNKQNLDIFLTHNVSDKHLDEDFEENDAYYSDHEKLNSEIPKTDERSYGACSNEAVQNLHNKSLQKVPKPKSSSVLPDCSYVPSTTASKPQDVRTNISVTIPSVQVQNPKLTPQNSQPDDYDGPKNTESNPVTNSTTPAKEPPPAGKEANSPKEPEKRAPKLMKQLSLVNKENEGSVLKTLPPRPMTAASKREGFQKRTNTAFNGSLSTGGKDFRPPLTRTLSVPVKTDKPKFIATKRRLKPARRKGKDDGNHSADEVDEDGEKITKKGSRCKSAPSGELVTMVSLVSPAGSDTEEVVEGKKPEVRSRNVSPVKTAAVPPGNGEPPKTVALRKVVKSVSFQQSSIHTVRSFSASFPSRRGSMAAALQAATVTPEREKRAPLESSSGPGESRGPKRRLLRSTSVSAEVQSKEMAKRGSSFDSDSEDTTHNLRRQHSVLDSEIVGVTKAEVLSPASSMMKLSEAEKSKPKEEEAKTEEKKEAEEETTETDPDTPKFVNNKEKECWVMYKKMSEKGLPVSFDTILRGMLTPTEYRSVRKEVNSS